MTQPKFLGEVMEEWESGLPMSLPTTVEEMRSIVVLNISRERERCAKIVESGICDGLSWEDKALQKAAEDIRKGESRYGLR